MTQKEFSRKGGLARTKKKRLAVAKNWRLALVAIAQRRRAERRKHETKTSAG